MLLASTNLVTKNPMDTTTVPATLTYRNNSIDVRALIDTGALHANYLNEETARGFKALGAVSKQSNVKVCSAFEGKCK